MSPDLLKPPNVQSEAGTAVPVTSHQAIVWIDASEACILRMDYGLKHESTILALAEGSPSVTSATTPRPSEGDTNIEYFIRVARALDVADEILITGPCDTKLEFARFMHRGEHALDPRILGVENIASRTDSELAAFARIYFGARGPPRSGNGS